MIRHRLTTLMCFAVCLLPAVLAGISNSPWVAAAALLWPFAMVAALALILILGALRR